MGLHEATIRRLALKAYEWRWHLRSMDFALWSGACDYAERGFVDTVTSVALNEAREALGDRYAKAVFHAELLKLKRA